MAPTEAEAEGEGEGESVAHEQGSLHTGSEQGRGGVGLQRRRMLPGLDHMSNAQKISSKLVQSERRPAMGYGVWAMGYGLWAMDYGLWAMGYGLWAMGYGLWAMGYGLGSVFHRLSG
ncbi:hypothetical protein AC579_10117 [Pseudocercospora musae]|uniref:Uncharacterized protein n=1 Tax=Pseudocercospora musae TaxID=113226 RepID=A0A139ISB7_9PEZI|nr:hypothetical protein AC579_10117 [Pseudocercospora musae]